MPIEVANRITPTETAKIPSTVHGAIRELARQENVNGLIVMTAYQLAFEALGKRRRMQVMDMARNLFPRRQHRRGRGNRLRD